MVSLIICSREPDISQGLKENIRETIGIQYELIVIDNSKNKYSIFQAYNEGVRLAKYPYLCFMHEDISYLSQDWGQKVLEHFNDKNIGCIGVIGGHLLSDTPSGWMHAGLVSGRTIKSDNSEICNLTEFAEKKAVEGVVVDGLWFCVPANIFEQIRFDDSTFNGFHCYDIDICLTIRALGKKIFVVNDILVQHFSDGNWDQSWVDNSIVCHRKWSNVLPQYAGMELSQKEIEIRTEMAEDVFSWIICYAHSQEQLKHTRTSMSLRLGKAILNPLKYIFKKK